MPDVFLNIDSADSQWQNRPENFQQLSGQIARTVLSFANGHEDLDFLDGSKPLHIGLVLSNDENIKKLNREFRNKDSATNVLSFAALDNDDFFSDIKIFNEIELGDIIIAFETLKREAEEKNIPFINHYTHLLVHGLLHLLGFDHIDDDEADYMESCEAEILKTFNIPNPYTE